MPRDWGYLIALGSNQRHARYGSPRCVLVAALEALGAEGLRVEAASPIVETAPLGPSRRRYANAGAVIRTRFGPERCLEGLQAIERRFGRDRRGQRWRARVLDLDLVLWTGGPWSSERLTIPHPEFRRRSFVLAPAAAIAAGWRDPLSGHTIAQLHARLTGARPLGLMRWRRGPGVSCADASILGRRGD